MKVVDSGGKALTTTAPTPVTVPAGGGVLKGQLDLSGLPFQIDVVLGYNVLRQLTLRIDYRQRLLTLRHRRKGN
jgi:hypothetical protein